MTFGAKYWESDTTVPIPSARFDSIYTVDRSTQYADGQTTSIENTQQSQFAPLLIVNAMHASPIPAEIPDMVEVPEICIYNLKCKHPTIKYIYDHLAGYPIPEFGNGVPGNHLGGYMVSFKLNFPAGVTAATQNIGIQMISPAHASDYRVVFREKNDTISNGVVISSKAPNSYMRTDSGHIKYKNHLAVASKNVRKNGQEVTIVIKAEGYRTRYVQTLIKPTYSTYVEVDLIPL